MQDLTPDPSYMLLYVANPRASADFYSKLLDRMPVEDSPTFVLYVLGNGLKFGLWKRDTVEPAATGAAGSTELCIAVESRSQVADTYEAWRSHGLPIVQAPTDLDFGHTFVALDPDGHRLRVFSPAPR